MINIDWQFIEGLEGFELRGYVPMRGGKPLGKSGVTVGAGIDLGQRSAISLARQGVPAPIVDQVAPYCGLRGDDAVQVLAEHPLEMTREDAERLTRTIQGDAVDLLVKRYDAASDRPFKMLEQQAQTVIASVAFQYGVGLATATPMFWRQVIDRDWSAAHANLLNFGDAYGPRRRKEAAYLADLVG